MKTVIYLIALVVLSGCSPTIRGLYGREIRVAKDKFREAIGSCTIGLWEQIPFGHRRRPHEAIGKAGQP